MRYANKLRCCKEGEEKCRFVRDYFGGCPPYAAGFALKDKPIYEQNLPLKNCPFCKMKVPNLAPRQWLEVIE